MKRLPKTVSKEDVQKLLKTANRKAPTGLRNYCMSLLMYRAGLRVSEITDLQCSQVAWADGTVRVIGKGDKERLVPLEVHVMSALEAWKTVKPKAKTLFCTLAGDKLKRRYVNAMLERYCKRAGIEHINPHTLRHTYATELLDDGLNIREVQELLGHSDISTTMIYTHVNPVEIKQKIRSRTT